MKTFALQCECGGVRLRILPRGERCGKDVNGYFTPKRKEEVTTDEKNIFKIRGQNSQDKKTTRRGLSFS